MFYQIFNFSYEIRIVAFKAKLLQGSSTGYTGRSPNFKEHKMKVSKSLGGETPEFVPHGIILHNRLALPPEASAAEEKSPRLGSLV